MGCAWLNYSRWRAARGTSYERFTWTAIEIGDHLFERISLCPELDHHLSRCHFGSTSENALQASSFSVPTSFAEEHGGSDPAP